MKIINVTTKEQLDELEKGSALTLEGYKTENESLEELIGWIKKHTPMVREDVYVILGKVMNESYGLTGDNAYPDGLHIVCVKLSDLADYRKIVINRYNIGGRWFDDVVRGNQMRQNDKN